MLLCIRLQLLLVIVPPPPAAAAGEAEEEIHQNSLPLHRNLHAIERSQLNRGHNARSQSEAIKVYGNAPRSKWGHIQLNSVRNKSARYKKGQPPVLLLIPEIYLSMEMISGTIIGIHTFTRRSLSFPTTHRNTLQLFHWPITGDPLTPSVPLPYLRMSIKSLRQSNCVQWRRQGSQVDSCQESLMGRPALSSLGGSS